MPENYSRNHSKGERYIVIDDNEIEPGIRRTPEVNLYGEKIIEISSSEDCEYIEMSGDDVLVEAESVYPALERDTSDDYEVSCISDLHRRTESIDSYDSAVESSSFCPNSSFSGEVEELESNSQNNTAQSEITNPSRSSSEASRTRNHKDENQSSVDYEFELFDNYSNYAEESPEFDLHRSFEDFDELIHEIDYLADDPDYAHGAVYETDLDSFEESDDFTDETYYDSNYSSDIDLSTESDVEVLHSLQPNSRNEPELVVLESVNRIRMFPRITNTLVFSIIRKLFFTYQSVMNQSGLPLVMEDSITQSLYGSVLRDLSEDELAYLKNKAKSIILTIIHDQNIVNLLIAMITPDKIDNPDLSIFPNKRAFVSTKFKNLMSVQEKSCTICFETFKNEQMCTTLKCLHTFHSSCIKKWVDFSWCCPVCRSKEIS